MVRPAAARPSEQASRKPIRALDGGLIMATAWLAICCTGHCQDYFAAICKLSLEGWSGTHPGRCADPSSACTKQNHSPRVVEPPNPCWTLPACQFKMLSTAICSAALPQEEFQFHNFPLKIGQEPTWARFAGILGHCSRVHQPRREQLRAYANVDRGKR
jgi:hypothetical protein